MLRLTDLKLPLDHTEAALTVKVPGPLLPVKAPLGA